MHRFTLIRQFTCTILFLFIIFLPLGSTVEACTYEYPLDKDVDEGAIVYYYVEVTNIDYPLGVDVKIDIVQDGSSFDADNTEFHLGYQDTDRCHIRVYTKGFEGQYIWTNTTAYERGTGESAYDESWGHQFQTNVSHPNPVIEKETESKSSPNIFLGVLIISIFTLFSLAIYQYRHIFLMRGYSLLRRDELLKNENRNEIYGLVANEPQGMTASEITHMLGFPHHRLTQYHLRRLHEMGYVKKIDNRYYSSGVNTERPFIDQIKNAMLDGAHTPSQIARKLGTYPNKVKRHMIKNGMWNR